MRHLLLLSLSITACNGSDAASTCIIDDGSAIFNGPAAEAGVPFCYVNRDGDQTCAKLVKAGDATFISGTDPVDGEPEDCIGQGFTQSEAECFGEGQGLYIFVEPGDYCL